MKAATLIGVLLSASCQAFVAPPQTPALSSGALDQLAISKVTTARRTELFQASNNELDNDPDAVVDVSKRDWRAFRAQLEQRSMAEGEAPKRKWTSTKWAMPIGHIEQGCVLIANEGLDGCFWQSVVLILDHSDSTGTVGVILNKPTRKKVDTIPGFEGWTLNYGGPCQTNDIAAVHSVAHAADTAQIAPKVYVGGFKDLIHMAKNGRVNHSSVLLAQGYAGWHPGQLQEELNNKYWYLASVAPEIITTVPQGLTASSPMWKQVLELMGGEYADIAKRNSA